MDPRHDQENDQTHWRLGSGDRDLPKPFDIPIQQIGDEDDLEHLSEALQMDFRSSQQRAYFTNTSPLPTHHNRGNYVRQPTYNNLASPVTPSTSGGTSNCYENSSPRFQKNHESTPFRTPASANGNVRLCRQRSNSRGRRNAQRKNDEIKPQGSTQGLNQESRVPYSVSSPEVFFSETVVRNNQSTHSGMGQSGSHLYGSSNDRSSEMHNISPRSGYGQFSENSYNPNVTAETTLNSTIWSSRGRSPKRSSDTSRSRSQPRHLAMRRPGVLRDIPAGNPEHPLRKSSRFTDMRWNAYQEELSIGRSVRDSLKVEKHPNVSTQGKTGGLRLVQSMMQKVTSGMSAKLTPSSARKGACFECTGHVSDVLEDIRQILEVREGGIVQFERKNEFRIQVPVNLGKRKALCNLAVSGEQQKSSRCRIQMRRNIGESFRSGNEEFDILCSNVFDRLMESRSAIRA